MSTTPMTMKQQFEALKAKVAAAEQKKNPFDNPNHIKLELGKSYKFRLIYSTNDATGRTSPFIKNLYHGVKLNSGYARAVCKRAEITETPGYCPVCSAIRPWYNESDPMLKSVNGIYRAKFMAYAPVYVIHDSQNTSNNGKVKILPIHKENYFQLMGDIFGVEKQEGEGETSPVLKSTLGFDAFDPESGFDLIVSVVKKGEYNNYKFEFDRVKTALPISLDQLSAEYEKLKFDSLHEKFDEQAAKSFVTRCCNDIPEEVLAIARAKLARIGIQVPNGSRAPAPQRQQASQPTAQPQTPAPTAQREVPASRPAPSVTGRSRKPTQQEAQSTINQQLNEMTQVAPGKPEESNIDAELDRFLAGTVGDSSDKDDIPF